jgi:DNA-binding NtrC family response regulator
MWIAEVMPMTAGQSHPVDAHGDDPVAMHRILGRRAGIGALRPLLVHGRRELDAPAALALRESSWTLHHCASLEDAGALCRRLNILAGLVLFPEPVSDAELQEIRLFVRGLPDLEWVALLPREALERADVRRFIVSELRDYQLLPVEPAGLTYALGHAWGVAALSEADRAAGSGLEAGRFGLIGTSAPMRKLHDAIERVAETDLPVLITGETGTGKELVARAIHALSQRAAGPFVAVNCAAVPASLMQAELFGVERGAFTGASSANSGLIRTAQNGTLLLDEVGEMPLEAQASLLRFLDDKVVIPVGGRRGVSVDVTVLAATNRNLHDEVHQGRFRQDLLYRLDLLSIRTPPLRQRRSDIQALAEHFLRAEAHRLPRGLRGFSADALDWLRDQDWPGNVRELRNCVIQASLHCDGGQITAEHLVRLRWASDVPEQSLDQALQRAEKSALQQQLRRHRGNVSKTARALGISRMTLYRLMAKHDIARG